MSTATAFDLKSALLSQLTQITDAYVSDLGFIPADKMTVSPMGKARTPVDFTAECAGFNFMVAKTLAGEAIQPRSDEERQAYYASLDTYDKAVVEFKKSVEALKTGLEGATEEHLFSETTTPWGMTVTVYRLLTMAMGHMMYHDGQINYIQSLYGDDQNHWG